MSSRIYTIRWSKPFVRKLSKLTKKLDKYRIKEIMQIFEVLVINPYSPDLNTHKVKINEGVVNSSRISGDLRLIWIFSSDDPNIILPVDIGGHSGKHNVYK